MLCPECGQSRCECDAYRVCPQCGQKYDGIMDLCDDCIYENFQNADQREYDDDPPRMRGTSWE